MDLPFDLSAIGPRGRRAIGLVAFTLIAWLFSSNMLRFPVIAAEWTIVAQIAIASLLLYVPAARDALANFQVAADVRADGAHLGNACDLDDRRGDRLDLGRIGFVRAGLRNAAPPNRFAEKSYPVRED